MMTTLTTWGYMIRDGFLIDLLVIIIFSLVVSFGISKETQKQKVNKKYRKCSYCNKFHTNKPCYKRLLETDFSKNRGVK